jgi:hypothetical protein
MAFALVNVFGPEIAEKIHIMAQDRAETEGSVLHKNHAWEERVYTVAISKKNATVQDLQFHMADMPWLKQYGWEAKDFNFPTRCQDQTHMTPEDILDERVPLQLVLVRHEFDSEEESTRRRIRIPRTRMWTRTRKGGGRPGG